MAAGPPANRSAPGPKRTDRAAPGQAKAVVTEEVAVAAPNANGKLRSELKGLNAVHANPQALANAAPNSQVGRIATYKTAALGTIAAAEAALTAQAEKDAAQALLDAANADLAALDEAYPGLSMAEIDAAVSALDPAALDYQAQLDALNADRAAAAQYEADRADFQTAADDAAAAVIDADLNLTEAQAEAEAAETAESGCAAHCVGRTRIVGRGYRLHPRRPGALIPPCAAPDPALPGQAKANKTAARSASPEGCP